MLISTLIVCSCGKTHRCDIEKIEIGIDALKALTDSSFSYHHVLVVADANTYPLCGKPVEERLGNRMEALCLYPTTDPLVPDEKAIATLESYLTSDIDFILGIGSGVINDLCKYVSFYHHIHSGIIATAPSMDGYASSGAAMILGGMKVTHTTHAPVLIIGDTSILKSAPMHMIRSGYGDIIGKYSSLCDWELAHLVCKEHFCQSLYNLVKQTADDIRDCAQQIVAREERAIEQLMYALVLSGMVLTLAETTRPGSGSEHHLSHFFEIVGLLHHQKHLPHGTDVAYNTVITASMREQICHLEKPHFCEETKEQRLSAWNRIYTSAADDVAALQRDAKSYETDLKPTYIDQWEEIKVILSKCPSTDDCKRMIEAVGLHLSECEELYGDQKIRDAMLYGKDLKNRYSVLWLYYALFSGMRDTISHT